MSGAGLGRGVYVIVDTSYREIARIHAGGHRDGDLHEFLITRSEGTALVTKNEAVTRDLGAYGGSAGATPVRRRAAGDRNPRAAGARSSGGASTMSGLDESHVRANENHFDYFHINSIDVDSDGHLLVLGEEIPGRSTRCIATPGRCCGGSAAARAVSLMGKGTRHPAWGHRSALIARRRPI